jgi:hypothetical protein
MVARPNNLRKRIRSVCSAGTTTLESGFRSLHRGGAQACADQPHKFADRPGNRSVSKGILRQSQHQWRDRIKIAVRCLPRVPASLRRHSRDCLSRRFRTRATCEGFHAPPQGGRIERALRLSAIACSELAPLFLMRSMSDAISNAGFAAFALRGCGCPMAGVPCLGRGTISLVKQRFLCSPGRWSMTHFHRS